MALVQVRLARDSLTTPWGFRLQGGKDLNQTLVVQRVFANTPSEGELHRGDLIVAINGRDTSNYTHKQAQDAISGGGGQIELLVSRPPPGRVHIKPLSPTKDTRAPTFPQSPTRAPQINIPIQRRSGPQSPSRVIPISPQKPAAPRPAPKPAVAPMATAGHMPKKVTLSKFGGGTVNFGYSPVSPSAAGHGKPQYRSVTAPVSTHHYDHPDFSPQYQPHAMRDMDPAPAQSTHQAQAQPVAHAAPAGHRSSPAHPQFAPSQPAEEKLVVEEELGGVSERRRHFIKGGDVPHNVYYANDDYDYPTAPVSERRRYFGTKQSHTQAVKRSNKPLPSFGRPAPGSDQVTFGVDYARPQPKPQQQPSKHSKPQRPRPPPVNARSADEVDAAGRPWSNTLRGDGRSLKPWEIEAMEAERYQQGTVDHPFRPSQAPPLAPKPSGQQRSVSPYGGHAPSYHQQSSPHVAGGESGHGPKVVHLQYNSPMGLYSNANIQDSYVGQTQGRALAPSGSKAPPVPGDRDWNNSYVYQMIHSEEKTTASNYQQAPGQAPKGDSVTTTRTTHETQLPGQEPHRTVTESVQRSGAPRPLEYNEALGMSDF